MPEEEAVKHLRALNVEFHQGIEGDGAEAEGSHLASDTEEPDNIVDTYASVGTGVVVSVVPVP